MNLINSSFAGLVVVLYLICIFSAVFLDLILNLWVIIELSMFLFISFSFLSLINENSISEGLLSYYLTQSGLSVVLLFLILLNGNLGMSLGTIVLFSNLGVAPMNLWFYSVFINSGLLPLYYMITLQNLPVFLFLNLIEWSYFVNTCLLILNLIICGIIALMAMDLKSLLISSSLSNNSWLAISLVSGLELFFGFFLIYSLTLYWVISGNMSSLIVLSLSGLPPFPLFFLNLIVIYSYFNLQFNEFSVSIGFIYIISALVLSAAYVRYYASLIALSMASSASN